jgi:rubrerythrin
MSFEFNADEILQMAERIERNGARFYRKASGLVEDVKISKILLDLASWEDGHERVFTSLREKLTEQERQLAVFDPEHETYLYLRAMADGHVFDVRLDPATLLTGKETAVDIFKLAIGQEKDSIVFYLGLQEMMPEKVGKETVAEVIKEEMRHIAFLNKQIATFGRDTN